MNKICFFVAIFVASVSVWAEEHDVQTIGKPSNGQGVVSKPSFERAAQIQQWINSPDFQEKTKELSKLSEVSYGCPLLDNFGVKTLFRMSYSIDTQLMTSKSPSAQELEEHAQESLRWMQLNYDAWLMEMAVSSSERSVDREFLRQLAWNVTAEPEYVQGDSATVQIGLTNVSQAPVVFVKTRFQEPFWIASIQLKRLADDSVVWYTSQGLKTLRGMVGAGPSERRLKESKRLSLAPGETEREYTALNLAYFFDLTETGEYELTFYTRQFVDRYGKVTSKQTLEYPRPCAVRFKIVAPDPN